MDFQLSEAEKMLERQAKEFVQNEVAPRAAQIDREDRFPIELLKELGRLGYKGLPFPKEYGGLGAGYVSYALVLEQIGRASLTLGVITAISTVPQEGLFRFGNEAQKKKFLTPLSRGTHFAAIAFTEPDTGSDPKAVATKATRQEGAYILNGQKNFVSLAPAADMALVFAKLDDRGKLGAFIVDATSPGFTVREPCSTMGLKGLGLSTIYLDDVKVPDDNLVGKPGEGFGILLEAISMGRLGAAIGAVGVSKAALDLSVDYALQRKAQGKPIGEFQTIKWLLAEMSSRIEAGRWLARRAAFIHDQGQSIRFESAQVKLFNTQMATEVTSMAMQVHGSYGAMHSLTMERLYRDAKMLELYAGVSEMQRVIIANNLLERGAAGR
jgi:alkylation response protein AidB-like acyl-CoA dehydrogenase